MRILRFVDWLTVFLPNLSDGGRPIVEPVYLEVVSSQNIKLAILWLLGTFYYFHVHPMQRKQGTTIIRRPLTVDHFNDELFLILWKIICNM